MVKVFDSHDSTVVSSIPITNTRHGSISNPMQFHLFLFMSIDSTVSAQQFCGDTCDGIVSRPGGSVKLHS